MIILMGTSTCHLVLTQLFLILYHCTSQDLPLSEVPHDKVLVRVLMQ
jgi:hypothetical protein